MRRRRWRSLVCLAVALALCAAAAGCAGAGGSSDETPRNDRVSQYQVTDEQGDVTNNDTQERASKTVSVDLVRLDVQRTRDGLRLVFGYAALKPRAATQWGVYLFLEPSRGPKRTLSWEEVHNPLRGKHGKTIRRWERHLDITEVSTDDEAPVACRGISGVPDFEADTLTIQVPSRCFGDPDWVRVSDVMSRIQPRSVEYVDSPFTDDSDIYGWGSPRMVVRR